MRPDEIANIEADLLTLLPASVLPVLVLVALHRGWVPPLRFLPPLKPREPALWGGVEVILSLGVWYVAQVAAGLLVAPFLDGGVLKDDQRVLNRAGAFLAAGVAATAASSWFIVHVVHRMLGQPLATLGLTGASPRNIASVILSCLFLLVPLAAVTAVWTLTLHHAFDITQGDQLAVEVYREAAVAGDWRSMSCLILAGVVLAPVGEEVLFRGLVFGWLRARWGPWCAAIASSLLFAGVHFAMTPLLPLFVVGMALAYVYARTGSLYFPVLFHALFNGVTFACIPFARS